MQVKQCPFSELASAPNFAQLAAGYAAEAQLEGMPPARPDMATYIKLDLAGIMATFVAVVDEEIVGFITLVTTSLPHYSVPVTTTESFYVEPSARRTGAGLALLTAAEDHAQSIGAAGLFITAAVGAKLEHVLDGLGDYRQSHRTFFKGFA